MQTAVRTYSLGMRQRLGLALALINEPELLILDEPTNGLDPAGILEMRELIRRLPLEHGITVFLSSHLLNEVEQIATHIGIIQQGRLKFQGQLADLQQQRRESISIGVEDTAQALNVLQRAGWAAHPDEALQRLTVAAHQPTQAAEINALLVSAGLRVFHLGLERPSLEETFLQLTNAEGVTQP